MKSHELTNVRELASRLSNGLQVRLLWNAADDRLFVVVLDTRNGGTLRLQVAADERPLDVFYHPFAYAERHHVVTDHIGAVAPLEPTVPQ